MWNYVLRVPYMKSILFVYFFRRKHFQNSDENFFRLCALVVFFVRLF
jgi:hypothetical protein